MLVGCKFCRFHRSLCEFGSGWFNTGKLAATASKYYCGILMVHGVGADQESLAPRNVPSFSIEKCRRWEVQSIVILLESIMSLKKIIAASYMHLVLGL
jgi:hypothetical protein